MLIAGLEEDCVKQQVFLIVWQQQLENLIDLKFILKCDCNKELDKAVKNKNVNDDDITEYMETGELPKNPKGTELDTEITDVIDRYRKTIYDNQEELSNLAGLNGDARLGSQYTYDPKTGKGTIYYTRSYQAAYDPRFVEIIDRALKGKSVVAITGPEKRRKSKVLDAIDAGRSFYKQQLLEGLGGKNKGLRLSDENALDEAQIQALQKRPRQFIFKC